MKEFRDIKVSIITVVYNGEKTLEETILSVLNQTYKNIEYIIIDGESKDGTVDIIKKYVDKIACWVSEPDQGIYDAMNKGILLASGDIIGILNSDDCYDQYAVEKSVQDLIKMEKWDAICGDVYLCLETLDYKLRKRVSSVSDIGSLSASMTVFHPSFFAWKYFYRDYGKYDTNYTIAADYDLLLRSTLKGAIIGYSPNLIAYFRMGGASSNQWKTKCDLIRIRKNNNVSIILQIKEFIFDFFKIIYNSICENMPFRWMLLIKRIRKWEYYE